MRATIRDESLKDSEVITYEFLPPPTFLFQSLKKLFHTIILDKFSPVELTGKV